VRPRDAQPASTLGHEYEALQRPPGNTPTRCFTCLLVHLFRYNSASWRVFDVSLRTHYSARGTWGDLELE
jgi:hypothetical protein